MFHAAQRKDVHCWPILAELGAGGSGTVYMVRYTVTGTWKSVPVEVHAQKAFQTVNERQVNLDNYSGSLPESLYLAKTSYSTLQ